MPNIFSQIFNMMHHNADIRTSKILSFYLAKKFFTAFITTLIALSLLITLFDFLDLLRRAASHPDVSFLQILELAALHLPYYIIYIFPFASLMSGIISFAKLARSCEITIMRAAGLSAFQCLLPPILCAILLGIFTVTCFTPFSSFCYKKSEMNDEIWLRNATGPMILHHQKLWLRQNDAGLTPHGIALLDIDDLSQKNHLLYAKNITLFRLNEAHQLLQRIYCETAKLHNHQWLFHHPYLIKAAQPPLPLDDFVIPSELTTRFIQSSAAPTDTISFWELPKFIHILEKTGFPTMQQRLKLQSLLALPFLAGTMVLVSAGFSLYSTRRHGITHLLGGGITAGFALFTISKIAEQLGKSGALPPILAAWAPTLAGLCFAATLLLHMEDG